MKVAKREIPPMAEGDMTPMIDMTFQLIAFFMVLINFSDAEQNQTINLPSSQLAIPPDKPFEFERTVQISNRGTVFFGGDEVPIAALGPLLARERVFLTQIKGATASEVTIIIRADAGAKVGQVQDVIKTCQDNQFEKFSLRAKSEEKGG
jgi:biopolymer transport protein ExbD